jgi:hypothetical protein
MTYQPTPMVCYNATLFLEAALKNENRTPNWLLASLKSPENPALIDNIIVTGQLADWFDDEGDEAPSYERNTYNHILSEKKETGTKYIAPMGPMLLHLVDAHRKFRVDFKFYVVCLNTKDGPEIIDVLDVEILSSHLTQPQEEMVLEWLNDRVEELAMIQAAGRDRAPHLKLVVVNE